MMYRFQTIFFSLVLCFSSLSFAHVALEYPKGGEHFTPGQQINIQWRVEIDHGANTWDLFFSLDGGISWDTIVTGIAKAQLNYEWTIPDSLANKTCRILVIQNNAIGSNYTSQCTDFSIGTIDYISSNNSNIREFSLYPAYPNPFNNSTMISFNLTNMTNVELNIYNIAGQKIKTLLNRQMEKGFHKISWDADDYSSGIYFCQIKTRSNVKTEKLILLK